MGDIITKGRPPVKACVGCPHCPAPTASFVSVYVAKDSYNYDAKTKIRTFVESVKKATTSLSSSNSENAFTWNDAPSIDNCASGIWSSNDATFEFAQNARFGVFVWGKMGAAASINIPYKSELAEYTLLTSGATNMCYISEEDGDEESAGYISVELTIEDGNGCEILSYNDDGTVCAGFNISATFTEEGAFDVVTVGTNEDFALPEADVNTKNRIYYYYWSLHNGA